MADIKVRVGQQNAIKVVSGISGSAFAFLAENVIGGIASVTSLSVSSSSYFVGLSTFNNEVYFNSDIYANGDIYSPLGSIYVGIANLGQLFYGSYYSGGVAYFDDNGLMVSTGSTISSIDYTNYILTVDNVGTPTWSNVIDGGQYWYQFASINK